MTLTRQPVSGAAPVLRGLPLKVLRPGRWAADSLEEHELAVPDVVVTEETMVDEMLAAVRELAGQSWTKIRPKIRGNDGDKAKLRDRLIGDGTLVNTAKRDGHFQLWLSDDPAAPRAELSTVPARASAASPEREPGQVRATVPYVSRHGAQNGTGDRGSDLDRMDSQSPPAVDLCLVCGEPYTPPLEQPELLRCPACIGGVAA